MNISLDTSKAVQFLNAGAVEAYESKVKEAQNALENATCAGNDFLGWLHLPTEITEEFLNELQAVANTLREKCEVVVVAGIGGSYLGARAVIEALGNSFAWLRVMESQNRQDFTYTGDYERGIKLKAANMLPAVFLAVFAAYIPWEL